MFASVGGTYGAAVVYCTLGAEPQTVKTAAGPVGEAAPTDPVSYRLLLLRDDLIFDRLLVRDGGLGGRCRSPGQHRTRGRQDESESDEESDEPQHGCSS